MSRSLLILKSLSYLLLLILTARLVLAGWDAVQSRRVELAVRDSFTQASARPSLVLKDVQERRPDSALARALEGAIDPSNGIAGIYVKSLTSGASAAIGEDRVFPTASLFKIPILVEVLRQRSLGMVDMRARVQLQQKHWAEGSGVLQAEIGSFFTVQELADYMVRVSDNTAALALLDLVGTDNVNLTLQANGFEATRLRIGWPSKDWGGRPGENTTTAREMGILLEKIASARILDERASEEAMRMLSQKQQVTWLTGKLPPGTTVAHKSGELLGVRHDGGVVYTPRGAFVVVVMTDEIVDYAGAADSIASVARLAYDYFETGNR